MISLTLILDKRTKKKDGTSPIKIRIGHKRVSAYIPVGIYVKAEYWDEITKKIITGSDKAYFNKLSHDLLIHYHRLLFEIRQKHNLSSLTAIQIRELLLQEKNENKPTTFFDHMLKFIEQHRNKRTRDIYKATANACIRFDSEIQTKKFEEITKTWLTDFSNFMSDKSPSLNARAIHLRNIRAVFNDAIDNDITIFYPFRRFKIKTSETIKRTLTDKELSIILNYDKGDWRQKYFDFFKLSFYLIGTNPVDILSFTHNNIQDGRIVFHRRKTNRLYSIKIEKEANDILLKYSGHKLLLSFSEGAKSYRHFYMKTAPALQQVVQHVTMYWARHTWATIASRLDISRDIIAQALGHGGHSVTDIYIKPCLQKVDEANRSVLDFVSQL